MTNMSCVITVSRDGDDGDEEHLKEQGKLEGGENWL